MSDLIRHVPQAHAPPERSRGAASDTSATVSDDDTIDLREVVSVLRRHASLVTSIVVICTAVAAFLAYTEPPAYRASAVVRLRDERQALTGPMGATAVEQMLGKSADPLLSELEVLKSRTLLSEVVDRLGLRLLSMTQGITVMNLEGIEVAPDAVQDTITLRFTDEEVHVKSSSGEQAVPYSEAIYAAGARFMVPERPSVDEAIFVLLSAPAAADRLQDEVYADIREGTDVIDISYTASDPRLARAVVNVTVDVFQETSVDSELQQSRVRRQFIEEQLAETEKALADAQAALSDFRRREEVLSSREQFAAQQTGIMELEVRREELDADRRIFRSLLSHIEEDSEGAGLRSVVAAPGLAENPVVMQLYGQLIQYQSSRDSLTAGGNSPQNPEVRRLNSLAASTQLKLRDAVRSHIASIDARIAALDTLRMRSSAEIRSLPAKEAEEMRIGQRLETASGIATQLREEYQRARIAEAVEVGKVEVVDRAILPQQPLDTNRALKVSFGLFIGLMLGSGAAFLREHLKRTISTRSEVEPLVHAPVLGVVPSVRIRSESADSQPKLRLPALGRSSTSGQPRIERPGTTLVTLCEAHSPSAEAFRTVRTNLIFSRATQKIQTLVLTSSAPAEGKSVITANLAIAFAQQGLRVALVDADLRRSSLHRLFSLSREPGLVDVLGKGTPLQDVLRPGGARGLEIITAGPVPYNPAELLGSTKMRDVLEELRRSFDLILIDTPPVLAAGDASVLSALSDGTVLILRAGQTDREAARAAADQIRAVGGKLLGAIMNDPEGVAARYGDYYYRSYYSTEEFA